MANNISFNITLGRSKFFKDFITHPKKLDVK